MHVVPLVLLEVELFGHVGEPLRAIDGLRPDFANFGVFFGFDIVRFGLGRNRRGVIHRRGWCRWSVS